jgi:cell division protein FtsL
MAAYIHGNLATDERTNHRIRYEVTKHKTVKKSAIPQAEKLLYLFSILIFVVVSGILVSRVTESYENNYKLQEIEFQIESLSEQNKTLQLKISELQSPERIMDIAQNQLGMVRSDSQVHLGQNATVTKTVSR